MTTAAEATPYSVLRAAILSLKLMPGEKLSERGLESMLKASRTPIRAALMSLANEGLTQRAGRGWQVTPIDLAEVRAVMEYREALESASVRLAVERAEAEELDALGDLARSHSDDEETVLREGGDFHVALARLSRNRFLADGMSGALTRLSRTRWLEVQSATSRAQAQDEHLAIIAAVTDRDAELAAERVVSHCRGTRERLLSHLDGERRRLRGRGFSIIESSTAPQPL
ncbi:GntR family transcriptional regulator [Kineosporia succinea]|uniref:DNA-binding GntR family transcriptional regulator n=1 Tax=Kineosporia succinea TaxID=84632 RepID=A0ABT9P6Y0_9ACTN|nr:GntR family transcriptional regulator [Kineosporia succinea]MDP9828475.1 DNA-binding GntR family transcriptional regulator [Kineosporia succinea]